MCRFVHIFKGAGCSFNRIEKSGRAIRVPQIEKRFMFNKKRSGKTLGKVIAFPSSQFDYAESDAVWPRLLTLDRAAAYCGLTTSAFARACPVRPLSLGKDPQNRRFDRRELDSWIDGKCETTDQNGWQNWLALMEGTAS